MKLNISAENKLILVSFGPILIGVAMLIVIIRVGFSKISESRANIDQSQKNQDVLNQKLNVINNVADTILSQTNLVTVALPSDNSALIASSQIKKYAFEYALPLSSVKTGIVANSKEGTKKIDVKFEVVGSPSVIYQFFTYLENMLPISKIDKIEITGDLNMLRASVSLSTYWAALPTKLPDITDDAAKLTDQDLEIVKRLSSFNAPIFYEIPSTEDNLNPLPFGE